ncbi:hypothetical protein [Robertmurraya mangrovi]|nr:hypothetical protein [Bacillus sp. 31A1R]
MYRIISFIVIFSFVSTMLYFHNLNSHHTMSNHHTANHHAHGVFEIPSNKNVPTIHGWVKQDLSGSWLLKIEPENFSFTPELIGTKDESYNKGHAHLYINNKKVNRLYGSYYNLDLLEKGTHHIKVSLHANDHRVLTHQGKEVAFVTTVKVNK